MKFLLDTCTISDFVKGDVNTLRELKSHPPHDLAVSVISIMEIHYGLSNNPAQAKKITQIIEALLASIHKIEYSNQHALQTAKIRTHLRKLGTPIGSYDLLIAGTALQNNLTLVTANEKEFIRVPDLKVANWRS